MTASSADWIIDTLGGTGELSKALDVNKSVVSSWRRRGIPPRRWAELVRLAAKKGARKITFEVLSLSSGARS